MVTQLGLLHGGDLVVSCKLWLLAVQPNNCCASAALGGPGARKLSPAASAAACAAATAGWPAGHGRHRLHRGRHRLHRFHVSIPDVLCSRTTGRASSDQQHGWQDPLLRMLTMKNECSDHAATLPKQIGLACWSVSANQPSMSLQAAAIVGGRRPSDHPQQRAVQLAGCGPRPCDHLLLAGAARSQHGPGPVPGC